MPRNKGVREKKNPPTAKEKKPDDQFKAAFAQSLKSFLQSKETALEFPCSLSRLERKYIHTSCRFSHLKTKSIGKGANRFITVLKREGLPNNLLENNLNLSVPAKKQIHDLLRQCPLTLAEREGLLPLSKRDKSTDGRETSKILGRLSSGIPIVPPLKANPEFIQSRNALPVMAMKDLIMDTINKNQVTIICGETGSGKTTQVPQLIMDRCSRLEKPCRIICSQPRRISAVSVSERVALERGDNVGFTVGYQIRLESRCSPKTILTYCTNGVLLRTLMGSSNSLSRVTHLIIDEVHDRDRLSDFILITIRNYLVKYPDLRLILMSATIDTNLFSSYFNNCPVINVPGKLFDVKQYFLEDILKNTRYMSDAMVKNQRRVTKQIKNLKIDAFDINQMTMGLMDDNPQDEESNDTSEEVSVIAVADEALSNAWLSGCDSSFSQLMHLYLSEDVPINYQHSDTGLTALMVAASRGCLNVVEQLLSLGADLDLKSNNGMTVFDWASRVEEYHILEVLQAYKVYFDEIQNNKLLDRNIIELADTELSKEDAELLSLYQQTVSDESVDSDLILILIYNIHVANQPGSILVFLPGYDDIVNLREKLLDHESNFTKDGMANLMILTLHSKMQTCDQQKVFKPTPPNTRKVILSTNIAETSVTIDDVVFVIDSGKVKEKMFNALNGISTLKSIWISQASANQRKGRAGRTQPGVCYHLFSRAHYNAMQKYPTPEILRFPLQELCLYTKLLAPTDMPIADFLSYALEPPSPLITANAIHFLKAIDALGPNEELTELGHHLLDLPCEPKYAKILLYSVVLKCLDPILTIISCLVCRDPFMLPRQMHLKKAVSEIRKEFSADTLSDHMALLKVFQAWQVARSTHKEWSFCSENFVSAATMEMIIGVRTHLLGQLRASGFVKSQGHAEIRELNVNSENWAVVKAAIVGGLYPNIIKVDRLLKTLRTENEPKVAFHSSSCLRGYVKMSDDTPSVSISSLPTDCMVFEEMSRVGKSALVSSVTLVTPITIALFAGPQRVTAAAFDNDEVPNLYADSNSDSEEEDEKEGVVLKLDEWLSFVTTPEIKALILNLRIKWYTLLSKQLKHPSKEWSKEDDSVLKTIVAVLSAEEQKHGLKQPTGIGKRPLNNPKESINDRHNYNKMNADFSRMNVSNHSHFKKNEGNPRSFNHQNNSPVSSSSCSWRNDSRTAASTSRNTNYTKPTNYHGDVLYVVIKCGYSSENILHLSRKSSAWAFSSATHQKLVEAFNEGKHVRLIFSLNGTKELQGYADLTGSAPVELKSSLFGPNLQPPLPIEWIEQSPVPFSTLNTMRNKFFGPFNLNEVPDGLILDSKIGESLCSLWENPNAARSYSRGKNSGNHYRSNAGRGSNAFNRPKRGSYSVHGNNNFDDYRYSKNSYSYNQQSYY
nr:PREDICTED: probable ATP-dependent RNA helicase YTHDC2 [Bemisia tabaci]XP_018900738.1 PREDICTED: probable ATP-dependent RNA helicase YTHDC2 [Bemisia tabaci]